MKSGRLVALATVAVSALVLAAPANAVHVTCGQVITTNTTLDSDVLCPPGATVGLTIGASNVTLNLATYRLISVGGPGSVGINGNPASGFPPFTGVQIRARAGGGGGVYGFEQGVTLNGSDSVVAGLTTRAGTGLNIFGDRNQVFLNVAEPDRNGPRGITVNGNGTNVARNIVRPAAGQPNLGTGGGIHVEGDNLRVVSNTVQGVAFSYAIGIHVVNYYDEGALVHDNVVRSAGGGPDGDHKIGIRVQGGTNIPGTLGATVSRNDVQGGAPPPGTEGTAFATGIAILDPEAIVRRNTSMANRDGFASWSQSSFTGNVARYNNRYGICNPGGATDDGGNTVSDNGAGDWVVTTDCQF